MQFCIKDKTALKDAVEKLCVFLRENGVAAEKIFDSRLVVNELLGNVFKHGDGDARLNFVLNETHIEITVYTATPFYPPKLSVCSDVYAEHGRGLYLIDSICLERCNLQDGSICIRISRN